MIKILVRSLWALFFIGLLAVVLLFFAIGKGWVGYMPPVEDIENPSYKFATEIISEDGEVLGTWSLQKENRIYASYNEIGRAHV